MAAEELGQPDLGLLQPGMEEAPARERSTGVRAGSCRPCAAGRPETLGEEDKGRGLSGQVIYDQRH